MRRARIPPTPKLKCGHCGKPLREEDRFLCGCGRIDICRDCAVQGREHFKAGWNHARGAMNKATEEPRWGQ